MSYGDHLFLNLYIIPHDSSYTFGVAASPYATNMAVKQNAFDLALQYCNILDVLADGRLS